VARWLRGEGHDVLSIYDEARGLPDAQVLERATAEGRILITADKGFGERIYRSGEPHRGVVLLRLQNERSYRKIDALRRALARYGSGLAEKFVVVTETAVRAARR
jgi:predicted nuclease of predicted toxin-antitoxin system